MALCFSVVLVLILCRLWDPAAICLHYLLLLLLAHHVCIANNTLALSGAGIASLRARFICIARLLQLIDVGLEVRVCADSMTAVVVT